MMNPYQVIKRPLLTEKTNTLKANNNQLAFEIDFRASKVDVRRAVEKLFEVKVAGISTAIVHGKMKTVGRSRGRQPNWKKAVVTLQEGQNVELFEGV